MAWEFYFGLEPGMLLIVDEPENSLHIDWQATFIDDLLRVTAEVGCDAIVATHSPDIEQGRSEIARSFDLPKRGLDQEEAAIDVRK